MQKPAAFHSEKRCKDKQKKAVCKFFLRLKSRGIKRGIKRYKSINKGYKRGILIPR